MAVIFKSTEGSVELVLDLGQLMPERLKEKNIQEKEVEDIIDRRGNYEKNENIVLFLKLRGALRI
jgi:hypothetical protein